MKIPILAYYWQKIHILNMNLATHYNNMYQAAIGKIRNGEIVTDSLIHDMLDTRRGLTVIIRPDEEIREKIHYFQERMRDIDHTQYYQPITDMHITVLSIISCAQDFKLDQIDVPKYVQIIKKSIHDISDIRLQFKGITASREAILIQGFPCNDQLEYLRRQLRINFKNTQLKQSIDARYTLSTAHITTARFQASLNEPKKFSVVLDYFRNFDFGCFKVNTIEFVYNDWYQKNHIVQKLYTAKL